MNSWARPLDGRNALIVRGGGEGIGRAISPAFANTVLLNTRERRRDLGMLIAAYEVVELVPGERLVMRTAQGPFPMETTCTWQPDGDGVTRMTLRNRGEPSGFASLGAPMMAAAMRRALRTVPAQPGRAMTWR
jgi:hypothetical protein